jgi:hypothetical protein
MKVVAIILNWVRIAGQENKDSWDHTDSLTHWLTAAGTNSRWDIYLVQNWAARWFLTYR